MVTNFDPAKVNPASIILKPTLPDRSNSTNYIDYIIMSISIILVILLYLRMHKKL